jgi:hypothetical protein
MGLAGVTDAFADYLKGGLSPVPPLVGASYPSAATDLPAVVVSLTGVTAPLRGIGKLPAASATGALPVSVSVDLANPVATFPDAVVTLLSSDRTTLTLPNGPLVAADGTTTFGAGDVQARLGASTFTVVSGTPTAGQVQPDPNVSALRFGAALPATGTLAVSYFVGEWEVRTERYQGTLLVEAFAADAPGVESLSREIETALLDPPGAPLAGLDRIEPASWQAIEESGPTRAHARGRALAFAFDYELVSPLIGPGGGLISTVSVFGTERFDVQKEGSSA